MTDPGVIIASFFEDNSFERIDKPTLPVLAVREALVNALCHRDYSNRSSHITLAIFDDRLELWNNGTLPIELKLEDLKKRHRSMPRNKNIAKVFYDRKFFDGWGGGIVTMLTLCQQEGVPEPCFDEHSGGFSVTFAFRASAEIATSVTQQEAFDLTLRQKEVLKILTKEGKLSLRDIISLLENPPSARTIGDDLESLKQTGLVGSEGVGRGAR